MTEVVQPTLHWYMGISRAEGVVPRCPFASVEGCPRYYQSLSLLGEAGFATRLTPDEDRRLKAGWEQSDLWPRTAEQASSVMGPTDDPGHLLKFCPEVSFDRFGLFAAGLHRYADEIDQALAHSTLKEQGASSSDWRWGWQLVVPMHYTECPLYSPLLSDRSRHVPPSVMANERNPLDPFRIALTFVADSDLLIRLGHAAGLTFDMAMSEDEAYSHKTRIRAILPRLLAAYDALPDEPRLVAARIAVAEVRKSGVTSDDALAEALGRAGWELRDYGFVVKSPDTREVFFPKGSQWDAFVVLKSLFAEAKSSITIIDAYCDGTVFKMIVDRPLEKLHVRILCSKYADALTAEAKAFTKQYPGATIEVRRTKDFHDRFIVLDDATCVHVGASIKDAGSTAFMVSRVEDQGNREAMLKQAEESWEAGTPMA